VCHYSCQTCKERTEYDCLICNEIDAFRFFNTNNSKCECSEGYFEN